jgi:hypothetical protein
MEVAREWAKALALSLQLSIQLELLPRHSQPQYYRRYAQKASHAVTIDST